jgi:hypothetical protein
MAELDVRTMELRTAEDRVAFPPGSIIPERAAVRRTRSRPFLEIRWLPTA